MRSIPIIQRPQKKFTPRKNSSSMLRKHNSKLQNSPNFRQFSAADLNISRDSRAGFFLKRAQDVPNYSSTADNFLVENGRRSPIETSKKQVQKFVRFNHLSSAQIENSLEISAVSCVQYLKAIFLHFSTTCPWNLLMKPRLMPQDPRDVPDYPADKRRPAP